MRKSIIIKPAILACSAGLLLTACHTERHERHAGYSSTSGSTSDDTWMRGSGAQNSSSQDYSSQDATASSQAYSSQNYSAQSSQQDQSSSRDQNNIVIPLHEEQVSVGKRTVDAGQVTLRKIVTTETVNEPVQLRRETLVIDREGAGAQAGSTASSTQHDANWQKGAANQKESASASLSATQENEQNSSAQASADQSSAQEPAGANSQSARSSSASPDLSNDSGAAFQEKTYTIRLQKEEPVIQKNVVQTGQVTARKNSQTQQQTIQQQIRKEDVQLDKSGAAQNVEIRGNFNTAGKDISEPSGAERHETIENKPAESQPSESIQRDSSGAQQREGVNESTDSTTQNRAPTKGQGAQDLKKQPEQFEP